MSADSANRVDQWQELGFEERFKTTEEELKLMQETSMRHMKARKPSYEELFNDKKASKRCFDAFLFLYFSALWAASSRCCTHLTGTSQIS